MYAKAENTDYLRSLALGQGRLKEGREEQEEQQRDERRTSAAHPRGE